MARVTAVHVGARPATVPIVQVTNSAVRAVLGAGLP